MKSNLATRFNTHSPKADIINFAPQDFSYEKVINGLQMNELCFEAAHLQHVMFQLGFERNRSYENKNSLAYTKEYPILYCEGTKGGKKIPALHFRVTVELETNEETHTISWSINTDVIDYMMRPYSPYYNRVEGQVNLNNQRADKHINKICNKLYNAGLITV